MSANYNILCSNAEDDNISNSCGMDEQDYHDGSNKPISKYGQHKKCLPIENKLAGPHLGFIRASTSGNYNHINKFTTNLTNEETSKDTTTIYSQNIKLSNTFSIIENPVMTLDAGMPLVNKNSVAKTSTVVTTIDATSPDKLLTTLTSLVLDGSDEEGIEHSTLLNLPSLPPDVTRSSHKFAKQRSLSIESSSSYVLTPKNKIDRNILETGLERSMKIPQHKPSHFKWSSKPGFEARSVSLDEKCLNKTLLNERPKSLHEAHTSAFKNIITEEEFDKRDIKRTFSLNNNTIFMATKKLNEQESSECLNEDRATPLETDYLTDTKEEKIESTKVQQTITDEPNIQSNLLASYDNSTEYVFKPSVPLSNSSLLNESLPKLDSSKSKRCGESAQATLYEGLQETSSVKKYSSSSLKSVSGISSVSIPCIADVNGQTSFKVSSTDVSVDKFLRSGGVSRSFGASTKKTSVPFTRKFSENGNNASNSTTTPFTQSMLTRSKSLSSSTPPSNSKRKDSESSSTCLESTALTPSENCNNIACKQEEYSATGIGNFFNK